MFIVSRRRRVSRTAAGDDGCMFVVWWRCVRSVLRVVSSCCFKIRRASACGFCVRLLHGFFVRLLRAASTCGFYVRLLHCVEFLVLMLFSASSCGFYIPRTHSLYIAPSFLVLILDCSAGPSNHVRLLHRVKFPPTHAPSNHPELPKPRQKTGPFVPARGRFPGLRCAI